MRRGIAAFQKDAARRRESKKTRRPPRQIVELALRAKQKAAQRAARRTKRATELLHAIAGLLAAEQPTADFHGVMEAACRFMSGMRGQELPTSAEKVLRALVAVYELFKDNSESPARAAGVKALHAMFEIVLAECCRTRAFESFAAAFTDVEPSTESVELCSDAVRAMLELIAEAHSYIDQISKKTADTDFEQRINDATLKVWYDFQNKKLDVLRVCLKSMSEFDLKVELLAHTVVAVDDILIDKFKKPAYDTAVIAFDSMLDFVVEVTRFLISAPEGD